MNQSQRSIHPLYICIDFEGHDRIKKNYDALIIGQPLVNGDFPMLKIC